MWFITLIVLAIAAVLVIKAVKAQSNRSKASEADSMPTHGLQGQLNRSPSSQDVAESQSAANVTDNALSESSNGDGQSPANQTVSSAGNQQEQLQEIREMIKILNLADTDSARLEISAEQFNALRNENSGSVDASAGLSSEAQADIADRLRRMLA